MIRKTKSLALFALALFALSHAFAASAVGEETDARNLTWRQTDTSIELLNGGKVVWRHVHDRKIGKPFMRVGLLDGTELTRPWPLPADYPKRDHVWHRALWWSWKTIDGVNYWEKNQEGNDPVKVEIATSEDGSATIKLDIEYHLPDQPPVVRERRTIRVGKPDAQGGYLIDWRATFTTAGDKDVVFGRNGYGGLAARMAAEYCPDTPGDAWRFVEDQSDRSRWVSFQGTAQNGRPAALVLFDHPDNPSPATWYARTVYPYMNANPFSSESITLEAGKSLTLRYGVLVHDGRAEEETIEKAWKEFVQAAE